MEEREVEEVKYTIRVGDYEKIYEGTPEEIFKFMQIESKPKLTPTGVVSPNITINTSCEGARERINKELEKILQKIEENAYESSK
ncbi:hypothetical protein C0966_00715 [Bacillus methanolicus]|uniref:hypothetical protein n=1 Tax=Bacillus methanolicus TaxID=1471 RepID=UPI0023800DCB|nr:hypothetical protein [Bacillus methanolicus]MDE3837930.1 hypothetical protein [Bacillus methanolicus]